MSNRIIRDTIQKGGEVNILQLDIISHSGVRLDVSNVYFDLTIYENLFSNSLTGTLTIIDKYNFAKNIPLIGKEKIELKFKTPSTDEIKKVFLVSEIETNIRIPGKNETLLSFRFSSPQFHIDTKTAISRSYNSKKITEIVSSVFNDYLKTENNETLFFIQDTSPSTSIVIPNWSPFQTINWLSSKCSLEDNCDYIFFEGMKTFYFVPVSFLKAQESTISLKYCPPDEETKSVDDELLRIQHYSELSDNYKKLEMENQGIFSSLLITYDSTYKDLKYNSFNYVNEFPKTSTLNKNPVAPVSYLIPLDPTNKIIFKSKSKFLHNDIPDQVVFENTQKRISNLGVLHDKIIKIDTPGDSRRRVGEVVEVLIPSTEFLPLVGSESVLDETLSGRYIISAIGHHIVRQDGYYMGIEMMKDSYINQFSDKTVVGGSVK